MDDAQISTHLETLVTQEHKLLEAHEEGEGLSPEEHKKLEAIRLELDRYWDLLRQRRAYEDAGLDPDQASLRDESTVEGYEQ